MAKITHDRALPVWLAVDSMIAAAGLWWWFGRSQVSGHVYWDGQRIAATVVVGVALVVIFLILFGRLPGLGVHQHTLGIQLPANTESASFTFAQPGAPAVAPSSKGGVPKDGDLPAATPAELSKFAPLRERDFRLVDIAQPDVVKSRVFERCIIRGPGIVYSFGSNFEHCVLSFHQEGIESMLWPVPDCAAVVGVIGLMECSFIECRFLGVGFAGKPETLDKIRVALGAAPKSPPPPPEFTPEPN